MNRIVLVIAMAVALSADSQQSVSPVKIPDAATAVGVAEVALAKIYGKAKIDAERPFNATLSDGVWHVTGTLYCKDKNGKLVTDSCVGGVAMADIRQRDGKVLKTGHGK